MAQALKVSQAYISQLERGGRPISRKLAARLARLPDLPPAVVPPGHAELDQADADFAADLSRLGYPHLLQPPDNSRDGTLPTAGASPRGARGTRLPRNPAAVVVAVLSRAQVAPTIMAAMPWVLMTFSDVDRAWLVDQARRRNLQNRLGFLVDLALELLRARLPSEQDDAAQSIERLDALRADLEVSRLANPDTLARVLTSAERQFFEEHRSAAARHWNLLTGMTVAQLPYK